MASIYSVGGVSVQTPTKSTYNLIPVVSDENRLENAYLTLRPVAAKKKSTWTYEYIIGSSLIAILGESWEKYVNNKTYKFAISMPSYKTGQLTFDAYFKEVQFDLILNNDDPNLRVYSGFSITWIEY